MMNFVMFEYEKNLIMSIIYMLYMMYQVYTHVTIKSCKQLKVSKNSILLIVKQKTMLDDFLF